MESDWTAAQEAFEAGDYDRALVSAQAVLRALGQGAEADVTPVEVWMFLGQIWQAKDFLFESEVAWRQAAYLLPERSDIVLSLAEAMRRNGLMDEAEVLHRRMVNQSPGNVPLTLSLMAFYEQGGRHNDAVNLGEAVLAAGVEHVELRQAIGNAHFGAGRFVEALGVYQSALVLSPKQASLLYNAALAADRLGKSAQALAFLDRVLAVEPKHLYAHLKQADLKQAAGDLEVAIDAYYRATQIAPEMAGVWCSLGGALCDAGRWDQAIECYETALESGLTEHQIFVDLGLAYREQGDSLLALSAYQRGLAAHPGDLGLRAEALRIQADLCDWSDFKNLRQTLLEPTLALSAGVEAQDSLPPAPDVLVGLPVKLHVSELLTVARLFTRYAFESEGEASAPAVWRAPEETLEANGQARARRILRIGYCSAALSDPGVAHRMHALVSRHDPEQVRVHLYAWNTAKATDNSADTDMLESSCAVFRRLGGLSDKAAAEQIRADRIDVLVDMTGYGEGGRLGVMVNRPAGIQVSWPLAYPGTSGGSVLDYVLVDEIVLPPSETPYYTEMPVWLPGCALLVEGEHPVNSVVPLRAFCGLPASGFVFCCFAPADRITPEIFALWMRILRRVPRSVLWLSFNNETAREHLEQAAQSYGIEARRLIFAPPAPLPEQLARYRHADLFLDTLTWNASEAAGQALWADVPVISIMGQTIASRQTASLLTALGLEDCLVSDEAAYETRAVTLAKERPTLQALKVRIAEHKRAQSVFEPLIQARALENAYQMMWVNQSVDRSPLPIRVSLGGADENRT